MIPDLSHYWNQAMRSPKGIAIEVATYQLAVSLRQRLYVHRKKAKAGLRHGYEREWDELVIQLIKTPTGAELRILPETELLPDTAAIREL